MNWFQSQLQDWQQRLSPSSTNGDPSAISDQEGLSFAQQAELGDKILALGSPQPQVEAIATALTQALADWEADPNQCNGLAVLGSPTDPIAELIAAALATLSLNQPVQPLVWTARPEQMLQLPDQLKKGFALPLDLTSSIPEVVVIPSLERCFLRAMFGLDGIEWIRDQVFAQRSRFWLVGCHRWAWDYLTVTTQLGSYFDATLEIPSLSADQLKTWLQPVWSQVPPDQPNGSNSKGSDPLDPVDLADLVSPYFRTLADISQGRGAIAASLWLGSLRQHSPDEEENQSPKPSRPPTIHWKTPTLPDLPSTTPQHDPLIYAVILHGGISLPHLALSLGDSVSMVQSQVQQLLRAGILQQDQGILSVRPIHHIRLRSALSGQNFLVGDS